MAGVFLLPLPVGYLNAATKKHVIMLTSISGVALLAGFISLTIMAVEQAKFADMWGDKFEKFHLSEAHQGSQLGGGVLDAPLSVFVQRTGVYSYCFVARVLYATGAGEGFGVSAAAETGMLSGVAGPKPAVHCAACGAELLRAAGVARTLDCSRATAGGSTDPTGDRRTLVRSGITARATGTDPTRFL
eukprot:CAMPEP_0172758432 /NCGR_PEP_ID=MMETSP1074-20121228/165695_1 /TAXON_ID=2916 /ORGANISM="Ceratium fusus, Strain PA161109" /LENGTH=187 /DNA_ID=CAMNT_0013592021 /DNA_START=391 /DNA_END=953 /DNA_ORIENTATION=-